MSEPSTDRDRRGGATLARRVAGRAIDTAAVASVAFAVQTIILPAFGLPFGADAFVAGGVTGFVANLVFLIVFFGYFVVLEADRGQTLGMAALSLRITSEEGGLPSRAQVVQRNVWFVLGNLIAVAGSVLGALVPPIGVLAASVGVLTLFVVPIYLALTIGQNLHGQGRHDRIAATVVVVTAT